MTLHSFLILHFNEKYIQEELFCFAVTFTASLSFFLVIFLFCPPSDDTFHFFLPEVALFTSRFGRRANSYSEIQFSAISHLLVNNRTSNRSKTIVIREPSTILRPKYFLQFNWWKHSSKHGDGCPIHPSLPYFHLPSPCQAAVLLRRNSSVPRNVVKWSYIQYWIALEVLLNKQDDVSACLCQLKGEQLICAVISQGCSMCPRSLPSINILNK